MKPEEEAKMKEELFDTTAIDPCWQIECGGFCRDCGLRIKRNLHFERMGLGEE